MEQEMRRRERQITDFDEIIDVLRRCDTLRIGISSEVPYVVPVSFGFEIIGGRVVIYFHGSKAGTKSELIAKNPAVCVEGDIFHGVEATKDGITTRYESIIGFGTAETVLEETEKVHALTLICAHYAFSDYPIGRCKGLSPAGVTKISLSQITGKRNLRG